MAVQQSSPHVDLGGPALLLGAGGDVVLLDLTGAEPDEVERRVGGQRSADPGRPVGARLSSADAVVAALAAGAALVHVDAVLAAELAAGAPIGTSPAGPLGPADREAVVVVTGEAVAAHVAAGDLLAQGVLPGRVVVEVPVGVGPHVVTPGWVAALAAEGLGAGAVLPPIDGSTDEAAGWEVGLTMAVLTAGVGTVRGAHPVRFRRTRAVFEALAAARPEPPGDEAHGSTSS